MSIGGPELDQVARKSPALAVASSLAGVLEKDRLQRALQQPNAAF